MIIPSIDLMNGHAVQLVGGKKLKIDAGDPRPIARKFRLAGEIACIDLDAAMSQGSNESIIKDLLGMARCRVGGGIRSEETARMWLDAGASKIILGTAAVPELLRKFPKGRLMAALDAVDGEIVVEGWKKKTGVRIEERLSELAPYVGGFLITMVEREGRLGGANLEYAKKLIDAARGSEITIAGGVSSPAEIAELDALGADAQVGMALYANKMSLAAAIAAPLKSDRADGLWPTVVVSEHGDALGLAYSSAESLEQAVESQSGVYHSRKRGLWKKGETSGATQELLSVDLDCDRDALRFVVRQAGAGFCHKDTHSCWGDAHGLVSLTQVLKERMLQAPEGSYTKRLFGDAKLLNAKILEEAGELTEATELAEIVHEIADVVYFSMVKMTKHGIDLSQIEAELDRRALVLTRRPGDAKIKTKDEE
ncbi:MAG: phosphoribosyl-ATP diphosphatase [Myxococcales bacterium]|nr:MAG: phosphoribosyl-ATP diphosphatase [Myxococcales bacterium]